MDYEDEPPNTNPLPQGPQETVRQFWDQFNAKVPGKVFTVLPGNPKARSKAAAKGAVQSQDADKSYEEACRECRHAVECIVTECERVNQKYTDLHFDIEVDLKSGTRDYLDGLEEMNEEMRPKGVKRVTVCRLIHFVSLPMLYNSNTDGAVIILRRSLKIPNSSLMAPLLQMCGRAVMAIAGPWPPCRQWGIKGA